MPPDPPCFKEGVDDEVGLPALDVGVESLEEGSAASCLILAACEDFDAVNDGLGSCLMLFGAAASVFTGLETFRATTLGLLLRSLLRTLGLVIVPYLRGPSRGSSLDVYSPTDLDKSERRERLRCGCGARL